MTTPSTTPPTPAQAVQSALDDASSAIGAARTLLKQGTPVDLKGLENHVEQACASIAALPAPDRGRMKPALVSLIDSLNKLTEELTDQHTEISQGLKSLGQRRQALSAYKPRGGR